jgi:phosphopantothenoylcysteine synthetase/decarboxylase
MSRLDKKNIYYIITGAPKAKYAHDIIKEMISEGAKVFTIPTKTGEGFTDLHILREIIGNIVKNDWDNNIKLPKEDAVLIAPCTFNTLNAIVSGRSDSYALSIIASAIGHKTPVFIAPAMNKSL